MARGEKMSATVKPAWVVKALLGWYDAGSRDLPWRASPGTRADPYRVWLSEIMLQQTTVKAVTPYYARFLANWPSIEALGAADLEEVLRAWAGLGYYARARNLHGLRANNHEPPWRALPGQRTATFDASWNRALYGSGHRRDCI